MGKETILLAGVDGYIGNALAQRLLLKGYTVIGIDNGLRRRCVEDDMGSFSAIPIKSMKEKEELFKELGNFTYLNYDVAEQGDAVWAILFDFRPDIIVNLAHIASGPYSMASQDNAALSLKNNILGTNNFLWSMKQLCPDAHYITIGTTGEYDHYSNIDIEEGYININHNGRDSKEMIYPRRPSSIYHSSKTASTYLIDFLTRSWDIRCTDIQQSVVFGSYTDEIDQTGIYSRFDSDEAHGTVINRFIVQSLLGVPLTVYGEGKHQRGFISLNDSIQALEIAITNPAERGHVQVWNQLSEWHSMNDVAEMVSEVHGDVEIAHIETPRNEHTGEHYYKYITHKLSKLGYSPTRTIKEEIDYTLNVLKPFEKEIAPLVDVVMPGIKWK